MKEIWKISKVAGFFFLTFVAVKATPQSRIAYLANGSMKYSSTSEGTPNYTIINLGNYNYPISVAENGFVLLRDIDGLVRWHWGNVDHLMLSSDIEFGFGAWITDNGTVFANVATVDGNSTEPYFSIKWSPYSLDYARADLPSIAMSYSEIRSETVQVSSNGNRLIRIEADKPPIPLSYDGGGYEFAYNVRSTGGVYMISQYEFTSNVLYETFSDSGILFYGYGINNEGDILGKLDNVDTGTESYIFNSQVLSFDPIDINNDRVIIGISDEDELVIKDKFGTRPLFLPGKIYNKWITGISDPYNSSETIVAEDEIFVRKKRRDRHGNPTKLPSPDFEQFYFTEIIPESTGWSDLYATDVSSNGTIIGEGLYTDPISGIPVITSFMLLKVNIVPDYDRNGVIDQEDYQKAANQEPFYFWINDDNDDGSSEVSGDDVPGSSNPDSSKLFVDGTRDLVDYFPLYVDLHGLLDSLDLADVELAFLGPAVNYVSPVELADAGMTKDNVGNYLRNVATATQLQDVAKLPGNVTFTTEMLEKIRDDEGLFLLDAATANVEVPDQPLRLVMNYKGNSLLNIELPLVFSNIEDMYRHVDLRLWATGVDVSDYSPGSSIAEPIGWPEGVEGPANDKHFIFLHGFRVSGEGARGTFAEVFKRMYQSGSNAKFTGVTWYGNDSIGTDYWENVIHAFESSEALANVLTNNAEFSGTRTIAAHSLGNMVVSSAIADHGLAVDNYYMLDAAVAKEAYDGLLTPGEQSAMRNPDWIHPSEGLYDWRLWASHWHLLFKDGGSPFGSSLDERSELTWRARFGILPEAYNFYSSTENVLANSDGSNPFISPAYPWNDGGRLAWVSEEMNKGVRNLVSVVTLDITGGWGFNRTEASYPNGWRVYEDTPSYGNVDMTANDWRMMNPSEISALGLTDAQRANVLRAMPFFRAFQDTDGDYPTYNAEDLYETLGNGLIGTTDDEKYLTRAKILAEAIPSLSFAAGRNEIDALGEEQNFDMSTDFKNNTGQWPRSTGDWWHSDFKDVSFLYVTPLYDQFIELGGLDAE